MQDDVGKKSTSTQKAYGRGYWDAVREMGLSSVKPEKLDEVLRGLNGVAKKVLDVCPKSEGWTVSQICSEMRRLGSNPDMRIVEGCLKNLVDQGLVKQQGPREYRQYMRVTAKAQTTESKNVAQLSIVETKKTEPVNVENAMEYLAGLAADARAISERILSLARLIDDAAIKVGEKAQGSAEEIEKLRQLQALLKSLGQQ